MATTNNLSETADKHGLNPAYTQEGLENLEAEFDIPYNEPLGSLSEQLNDPDFRSKAHRKRIRDISILIGQKLGLDLAQIRDLGHGAFLHDVGKAAVSELVLQKSGKLTDEERQLMQEHCDLGHQVVSKIPGLEQAAEIVWAHHERYDGSGYPRQLQGDAIPLGARIVAVADSYDDMRTRLVYSTPMSADEATEEVRRNSGTQFDPDVVIAFLECRTDVETIIALSEDMADVNEPLYRSPGEHTISIASMPTDTYAGLTPIAAGSFPKKCMRCGTAYPDMHTFLTMTEKIELDSGLANLSGTQEGSGALLFRNCTCGTTLAVFCRDRRDMTAGGHKRRKLFERLLDKLEAAGIDREVARLELLATMDGIDSPILRAAGIRFG